MPRKISRKQFIESHGATCRNWQWSWSFVNTNEKVVIFGAWDKHKEGDRVAILDETWQWDERGYRKSAYRQSLEHIRLVENRGYTLKIFRMTHSDERQDHEGRGPAKIEDFIPHLESKSLKKEGSTWYAVG